MSKTLCLIIAATLLAGCLKQAAIDKTTSGLKGIWVTEGDIQGRQPADTLVFFTKNGKNMLSFYSAGSPGPNWPSHAETEYRYENGKLSFKDYSGASTDFLNVESFQWTIADKVFSVKLYQVLHFMSADYRVTYRKIN
ncbi:MAG: hypothetical protein H7122_07920 [Chitinophagaceae bacterium]|nr:hypothetical protein [Chitinophagaceae bacterium]